MKHKMIAFFTLKLIFAAPIYLGATTFSITNNIPSNTHLSSGTTFSGQFSVSSFLPASPYTISKASFEFKFSDNDLGFSNRLIETFGPSLTKVTDVYSDNEYENVQLVIGSYSGSYESTFSTHSELIYSNADDCPAASCNVRAYYDYYSGYYNFPKTVSAELDPASIKSLSSLGHIDWSLHMAAGGILLDAATLTVEYELKASPVPEPSTVLLFTMALTGLGALRIRRHA